MERTKYMQQIMNETYAGVAIEAIQSGTLEGAWEKLIARRLLKDYQAGHSEAEVILSAMGGINEEERLRAAKYITSSKIPESCKK